MAFDPTQFGATPVTSGVFDPTKFGATPIQTTSNSDNQSGVFTPHPSFMQKALGAYKDVNLGVVKGAGSTLTHIGEMGQSVLDQTVGRLMNHGEKPQDQHPDATKTIDEALTPRGTAQDIGFGAEKIGEFLIPGGAEADAANLASKGVDALNLGSKSTIAAKLASKSVISGVTNTGVAALQGSSAKDIKNTGLISAAFPIAGFVAKGLGKVGGAIAEHIASTLSGVPKAAIQHAIENPEAVQAAIKVAATDGEGATQRIYDHAMGAMDDLKQARRVAYQNGLAQLEKDTSYTKNGTMYIKRALTDAEAKGIKGYVPGTPVGVPTKLTTSGIKNVFTSVAKEFGAEGGGKGGLDFTNVALDDSHINKLQKLQDRIYSWTDTTPTGINKLRQVVASYEVDGIKLGSSELKFNKIIGDLKSNLSSYVGERVPQIAKMNQEYAASSKVIDNIRNQLKLGSADPNTALRKLMNVFNPKSSLYRPVVEQLGDKAGKQLMSDIAGLTMSKMTPEGLGKYITTTLGGAEAMAALHNPAALVTLPATLAASSPRIVGEVATKGAQLMKNKTAQAVTGAVIKGGKALIKTKTATQK